MCNSNAYLVLVFSGNSSLIKTSSCQNLLRNDRIRIVGIVATRGCIPSPQWKPTLSSVSSSECGVIGQWIFLPFRSQVVWTLCPPPSSLPVGIGCLFKRRSGAPAAWPNAPPESRGLNWGETHRDGGNERKRWGRKCKRRERKKRCIQMEVFEVSPPPLASVREKMPQVV